MRFLDPRAAVSSLLGRVRRVGLVSLSSLVVSGVSVILFAQNIYTSRPSVDVPNPEDYRQAVFHVGSELSVQSWLAVLGVVFGILSYGLTASCVHFFDCWCSWRASRVGGQGLDYARYLNSQPQAPVMAGLWHGFSLYVLCRYIFVALTIAASIGYKFAVIEVTTFDNDPVESSQVRLQLPPVRGLLADGTTSPWVGDYPLSVTNRAFFHEQRIWTPEGYTTGDSFRTPLSITLAGWANCSGSFGTLDRGFLVSREIVMVANVTEDNTPNFLTSAVGNWTRVEGGVGWIRGGTSRAVVEYRIQRPGQVQIQWAEAGSWVNDPSDTKVKPVITRLTYEMRLAAAEVRRLVENGSCSRVADESGNSPQFLSFGPAITRTKKADGTVPLNYKLLDAILDSDDIGPREGVSIFVQGVMATWAAELAELNDNGIVFGHAPADAEPFGPENKKDSWNRLLADSKFGYPFFDGRRHAERRGSYYNIAEIFTAVGSIAIVVAVARILLGPPTLTQGPDPFH
ncbi:hypothetical protein CHGG_03567 [Chaetomium globosum CBS 148.51]|uniref:Uncharacterized protein n=1 Tax=Chaetomium globosum (strain ATCC 6205 / CBS 148.51 / DSM 1962 / NBRC 6347 / NRRL 1970) TaxID=306901 RepID=Q2H887_CHAGB|nr:uncharacterized protein CHGG_03567 [Chaetomium globosum CBS 148.51]EAQ91632.1 hypothetical protein CHGG_03567 [Chaetomium globosum CBS 148.51]